MMATTTHRINGVTIITAVEDDLGLGVVVEDAEEEDVIPGPPPGTVSAQKDRQQVSVSGKRSSFFSRILNTSTGSSNLQKSHSGSPQRHIMNNSQRSNNNNNNNSAAFIETEIDELQLSMTEHHWAGAGILASRTDLDLPPEEFAAGCNLLQAAASGNQEEMVKLLSTGRTHVNFRDYDRRTALHVAASEGHLDICKFLVEKGARINRSDRWGGSPLDDAHRHRHAAVITFLRQQGGTTGSGNRSINLIAAAADGDVDEVRMLLQVGHVQQQEQRKLDVNKGDYDKRTALHLAAGEGHSEIVKILCDAGADVNVEDRWMRRPMDDAIDAGHMSCVEVLKQYGGSRGTRKKVFGSDLDQSGKHVHDNLRVDFSEIEMIDRIGSGAFGEIYKCRWRGTLVAAKIIKSAKIRRDWVNKRAIEAIKQGKDVDDAVKDLDDAEIDAHDKNSALADFRQEIKVLKSLRHPHIVLLLAYSTTEDYECLISELMKCSLLDVFKSHIVQGTKMPRRTQVAYATQLALGMNYLHTCRPPIIHRDLKPANLLIDHSGVLKISDFGLSKIRPDPKNKLTEKFVMTGETGSYRFMAPECYRHEDYNETVDVYSFAMILFYLLVGRPPWPHMSGIAAVKKAAEEGDRPNIPRDMDVRMQNILKECWDENPSLRPSFKHIVEVLAKYNHDVFKVNTSDMVVSSPPSLVDTCCHIL